MSDDSNKNTPKPDLSALSGFQFGPAWARAEKDSSPKEYSTKEYKDRNFDRKPGKPDFRRDNNRNGGARPFSRDRDDNRNRGSRPYSKDRDDNRRGPRDFKGGRRFDPAARNERPAPEPIVGIRAEIRPINAALASIAQEIHKHKRCYSLYDLAKVFMGGRERYEIWYIKEESGPEMIACKKAPAVWLDAKEAVASLWQSPWFNEFYEEKIEEIEAPKGQFNAIARCGMSNTLIGPVNWHGYQVALAKLHAERFANMPFEKFRSRVVVERSDEVVAEWLETATKRSVWVPKREGSEELTLTTRSEVEADFRQNHYEEVFEVTGKCFVPGNIASKQLSQGLFAHLLKLVETARRHPAQIIPNVCHGLARHHLPIFKWKGGHHTGPSRPHALPAETQLAERPSAIIDWITENPGGSIESMITSLAAKAEEAGATIPDDQHPIVSSKEEDKPAQAQEEAVTSPENTVEVPASSPEVENKEMTGEEPAAEEAVPATEEQAPTVEETTPVDQAPVVEEAQATEDPKAETENLPEEEKQEKTLLEKLQDAFLRDLMWLLQQGFVLVTPEGKVYNPKVAVPANDSKPKAKKSPKAKKGKAGKEKPAQADTAKEEEPKAKKPVKPKKGTAKPAPKKEEKETGKAETEEPVTNEVKTEEEQTTLPPAPVQEPVVETPSEEDKSTKEESPSSSDEKE